MLGSDELSLEMNRATAHRGLPGQYERADRYNIDGEYDRAHAAGDEAERTTFGR